MKAVRTFKLGLKSTRILHQVCVDKHTFSAVTEDFKENKHVHSETNIDGSLKIAQLKDQSATAMEIFKLESKLLKEMISVKDALIHSKDALLDKEMVIRSFLEAELLSIKHKLHCRGVIERFEHITSSAFVGQPKMTRSATWVKILKNDYDLQKSLSELKGFPLSVASSDVPVVIAKLVREFYQRLSNDIHKDPSGQTMCIINKNFCSDWEMGFMVEICKAIPVRHKVENADQ